MLPAKLYIFDISQMLALSGIIFECHEINFDAVWSRFVNGHEITHFARISDKILFYSD